jgi:hypothetical protein
VSRQLGHSSIAVTVDLYGHFVPGADRHHAEGRCDRDGRNASRRNPRATAGACPADP